MALSYFESGKAGSRYLNAFVDALNAIIAGLAPLSRVPAAAVAAPVNAVASALTTALVDANNDLVFTAKTKGVAGDGITIALVDPAGNDQALSVAVAGTVITVRLATGPAGAITTTAAQLKAAIEAKAEATALVSVANAAANDGTGVVTALVATPLAGGVNGTVGTAGEQRWNGTTLYVLPPATANTISGANWYKQQFTLVS